MSLLVDFDWKLKYTPEDGDLVKRFYVPALQCATRYDRSTGFFSATALTLAARGIEGLVRNDGHMRLVVGCTLHEEEVEAIRKGETLRATVEAHLGNMPLQAEHPDEKDALELLAWMVAKGILDVRVAVPCDQHRQPISSNGIFHEKAGIVEDKAGHRLAWNGSLNETVYGWQENWESINVFRSWETDSRRVDEEEQNFARIWAGHSPRLLTLDVHSAIEQNLLRFLPDSDMPARLDKADLPDLKIKLPAAGQVGGTDDGLDLAERRRLLWGFIKYAPSFDRPGAERVGEATAAVEPWPHQIKAFERMYRQWPPKLLIADEVGLGKTIQAGLLLRQSWLAGRAKRILILAPKAVLKQWQLELREKFNLNWPIYDGHHLEWYASPALRGKNIKNVDPDRWHEEPIVLASSQLLRRVDRAKEMLEKAAPWDLIVLDEAHHARRKSPGATKDRGPNALLRLMLGLREKTQGLLLLTATPLQVHPVEVWDLLNLLGMPPEWTDRAFVGFYEMLAKPSPSHEEFESLAALFRALEKRYGEAQVDSVQAIVQTSRLNAVKLLRDLRDEAAMPRRSLSVKDRESALRIIRLNSPVGRLISRNTRDMLRRYYKEGRISTPIADRSVDDRFLAMTVEERQIYELVETYIRDTYKQASTATRTAVGFVMTIYRKRLASSFYALARTLEKRLAALKQGDGSLLGPTEDDMPDDDLAEEQPDTDEIAEMEREALNFEERSSVEDLLRRVSGLAPDTKARELRLIIDELRGGGYGQVMVFTQFTDTMDFLRNQLRSTPGLRMMCYSGRGGEVPIGDSEWEVISRDAAKRRFKNGDADVLLCTDAAAEGLNFQFCGALINYDLPWNPMRVEQRIGRIDRVGQKYPTIRIVNLQYDDTIETTVYRVLQERIGFFTSVVGKLQPILSSVSQRIAAAVLAASATEDGKKLATSIEDDIAAADASSFDLDNLVITELDVEQRPAALYGLGELRDVLSNQGVFLPEIHLEPSGNNEFQYLAPGQKKLRVTVNPEYYDTHSEDVELWSSGSPAFPNPVDIAEPSEASKITLESLLAQRG
ncbi:MAG: SNF2-related protein [Acidobacteriaceae bacterium]